MSLFTEAQLSSLVPTSKMVPLKELFAEERRFTIPLNQRPWVWRKGNLRDVWTDLDKTFRRFYEVNQANSVAPRTQATGNPHFFGAFVFYEKQKDLHEVVDGQQRLTTLSMIAAIFRELAQEVDDASDSATLRSEAKGMVASLTSWLLSNPAEGIFRLQLDLQSDELFREYVGSPHRQSEREAALLNLDPALQSVRANLHIKRGFDDLREVIRDDLASLEAVALIPRVRAMAKTLEEAFVAAEIVVGDEPFALSVFGALNARGVALDAADQIKNELFERSKPLEHQQIKDDWDSITAHVPGGAIEHFLRERHLAFVNAKCPKSQLYVNVRDRELDGPLSISAVTARWRKDAELLSRLTMATAHPKIKGEVERRLLTLHALLGITYSWSLLLSAGEKYLASDIDTFGRLVRLTLAFCFRLVTVGQEDVAKLERVLAGAAHGLTVGSVDPKGVAKMMRDANPDSVFEEQFKELALRNAKSQFYALYELEIFRSNQSGLTVEPFPHSPSQNIEHILPRKLSPAAGRISEWAPWRLSGDVAKPTEEHAEYVNRIGNLLILEGEINRAVSNYDFAAKQVGTYPGQAMTLKGAPRKCYKDSGLHLVKDVCNQAKFSKWTPKEIDQRQALMAKEAVKAWTLRYK